RSVAARDRLPRRRAGPPRGRGHAAAHQRGGSLHFCGRGGSRFALLPPGGRTTHGAVLLLGSHRVRSRTGGPTARPVASGGPQHRRFRQRRVHLRILHPTPNHRRATSPTHELRGSTTTCPPHREPPLRTAPPQSSLSTHPPRL